MFVDLPYSIETLLHDRINLGFRESRKLCADAVLHQSDSAFEKLYGSVDTLTNTKLAGTQHFAPVNVVGELLDVVFHLERIAGRVKGVNFLTGETASLGRCIAIPPNVIHFPSGTFETYDGVSLLMAYALDLNPRQNLRSRLPTPVVDGDHLAMSFQGTSPGITYTVQTSTDLQHWTTEGLTTSDLDPAGRRTAMVPRNTARRFLRLLME